MKDMANHTVKRCQKCGYGYVFQHNFCRKLDRKQPKQQRDSKVLVLGIALSFIVLLVGGIVDSSHIFGNEATLPIIMSTCMIVGMIIGVGFVVSVRNVKIGKLKP